MRVAKGGQRGHGPPKVLENIVILCFESRVSKQNIVIRLKSNIMAPKTILPPRNFWAGYAAVQAFQVMGHPRQTSPKWTP